MKVTIKDKYLDWVIGGWFGGVFISKSLNGLMSSEIEVILNSNKACLMDGEEEMWESIEIVEDKNLIEESKNKGVKNGKKE